MVIDNFTPVSALLGGALIGLAATLLLLVNGRMAGISGIAARLLQPTPGDVAWRLVFLAGLLLGAGAWSLAAPAAIRIEASLPVIVAGGLLVGFGTQLGRGCTSGHGVCGIARLSPRSFAATATFMATAMLTVYIVRHGVGG